MMRTFENSNAATYLVRDIEVARWEQYQLGNSMPFKNMWYTVPAGVSSPADCHPERELSVVVSGRGAIEVAGATAEVRQGDAFLFESMESHIIHNHSTDAPLMVFSTYWEEADNA